MQMTQSQSKITKCTQCASGYKKQQQKNKEQNHCPHFFIPLGFCLYDLIIGSTEVQPESHIWTIA